MKKRVLAIAFAALGGLNAQAGERTWYAAIEGGANWTDASVTGALLPSCGLLALDSCRPDLSTDASWAAFGTIGMNVTKYIRIEGEVGYRSEGIGDKGDLTNTTLMLNGLFDIPVSESLTFSVGAGAGYDWAATDQNIATSPQLSDSSSGFAYQALAEISLDLTDNVGLTVAYRYLDTSSADRLYADVTMYNAGSDTAIASVDEMSASSVTVGLRFAF